MHRLAGMAREIHRVDTSSRQDPYGLMSVKPLVTGSDELTIDIGGHIAQTIVSQIPNYPMTGLVFAFI